MKKLFKSYIALAVLALGFSACTEEVEYTPAEAPTNAQVYFSNTNGAQIDLAQDAKSFDIAVSRVVAGDAASIDVTVTADEAANEIFEFPATVEFADSAATATYTVTVKEGVTLEYDAYNTITLAFDEALTTPYGNGSYTFAVGVPAPWGAWKEMKGTYNFSLYTSGAYAIPVYYREHMLDATKGQFLLGFTKIGIKEDVIVDYNKETGACQVGVHHFLDNSTYGPVYLSDMPNYPLAEGLTYDAYPCTYDAEKGLFSLNLIYFVSEALGSSASGYFAKGVETLQLDGYYVPDYSLNMEYRGNYVDKNGTNNAVISTTKGVDVAKYLMTVISSNENANDAVSGMLAGTVACDTLTEAGFYAYPITESGNYKVLAITFDAEDNAVEAFSTDFEFWVAGDSNPWESLGYAVYTDDLVLPLFSNPAMSYYVEVLENKEQPGMFRLVDLYGSEHPLYPYSTYEEGSYIEIDATDPEGVWFEGIQSTGMDVSGNGLMSLMSLGWYTVQTTEGATKEDAKEAGLLGVYADGVITFPANAVAVVIGSKMYYGQVTTGFHLDMTNLLDEIPAEEGGESAAPAARKAVKFQGEAMGKVSLFKKIDNSFLTLKAAEIE